ncbi:cob(I)yrinic acid a,c-diamide adenosyltransferase [Natronocalculus amylovorans]|uniref:Cob(I)yrinic acid a,c-diamide adenosyltransferase n=1 Tax=Natronocalculus amylovorans TaxID=2917812 RepID=A0AAE3K7L2_9EURY|nr:cob(I)yrinic acid a,c-diamide adenosyltransferase [Natronocalculus amylovorans]MCL9815575.1 cob(I)yrinic acid a,c-diamide adenosyltransferase [Natronocalculus amylovorans]NUE01911.1 cob(I)yrinic acid a,c-diamide adenosyltransferase [Halorubraceae archaeon YAN]
MTDPKEVRRNTPGKGIKPTAQSIEPTAPDEFGLTQVWWGDGKGKTTAAMGMGFRAAGHGYRVHMLQFMKGGADSVESVRGEYNAIAAMPGFSYENTGHYGWHGLADGSEDSDHQTNADAALERTFALLDAAQDAVLSEPIDPDSDPAAGVHMLILDEILYAADQGLLTEDDVLAVIDRAPDRLELVLTGSHTKPEYLYEHADLVTQVGKEKHPIDAGQRARSGTEY